MNRLLLATCALCALPNLAWGQDTLPAAPQTSVQAPQIAPDAPNSVEQVVVTANRAEEARDHVPFSITVLDAARIRQSQAVSAVDLLAQTPGVSFNRNGGPGQTTGVSIRGAETSQTLVVIDGVRVNDPSSPGGGYDFGNLLLGDVSRIEVLRGPQSTLWGSQAIGGVVNIITAEPTEGLHADGQVEGGSYGTFNSRAGVGGKVGRLSFRVGGGYFLTDGVSAFDRRFGGKEDDGFRQGQVSGRAKVELTADADLDLRAFYTDSRTSFDGFPPPLYRFGDTAEFGRTQQFVDYTGLNLRTLGGALTHRLAFQYAAIDRANLDPSQAPFDVTFKSRGRTERFEYQGTAQIRDGWRATFGAERERTAFDDLSPFAGANARPRTGINSGYAQLQADVIPSLTLTAGGRYDDHDTFGGHSTGQVGAAWRLNGGATVLRASYGSGFKAPTLYQLYSDYGNTGLNPEEADGWDAGIEQRLANGKYVVQASYFGRDTTNLIVFTSCSATPNPICNGPVGRPYGYYANVAKTFAQGVELQGQAELATRLILSGQYTFTDAEDRSPGSFAFGKHLQRRPQHTASATLTYGWSNGASVAAALRYAGDSFDDRTEARRLKSYTLIDLRGSYPINPHLELYGRVENLADERYETVYQYGTLGRAAYGGVRVRF